MLIYWVVFFILFLFSYVELISARQSLVLLRCVILFIACMVGFRYNIGADVYKRQVFPSLILSFIMGGIVFICISFFETDIVKIVIGCITGMSFYILLSFLFKLDSFFCILTLIIKTKNIDENIKKDFSSNSKDN